MSSVASLKRKLDKISKDHQALNQEAKETKLKLAIAEVLEWSDSPNVSFRKRGEHLSEHYVSIAVSLELLRSIEVQIGELVTKSSKKLHGACARMVDWDNAMKVYVEENDRFRRGQSREAIVERFEDAVALDKAMDPMRTLSQMAEDSVHRLGLVVTLLKGSIAASVRKIDDALDGALDGIAVRDTDETDSDEIED